MQLQIARESTFFDLILHGPPVVDDGLIKPLYSLLMTLPHHVTTITINCNYLPSDIASVMPTTFLD